MTTVPEEDEEVSGFLKPELGGESSVSMASYKKTYNTRDSLVVTDPTTSLALTCLSRGEQTGSRVLKWVWSYVMASHSCGAYEGGWWSRFPLDDKG